MLHVTEPVLSYRPVDRVPTLPGLATHMLANLHVEELTNSRANGMPLSGDYLIHVTALANLFHQMLFHVKLEKSAPDKK